jgi:hypothetical protein
MRSDQDGWTITKVEACMTCGKVHTDQSHSWNGPRNLPKPDARKRKRREANAKRKINRGVYSGR